jgi:xylan 1,4-beta-xylosidase
MLGKLGGEWLESESDYRRDIEDIMSHGVRDKPDVNVVATRDEKGVSVLVWHYHDDDQAGPAAEVSLSIDGWGSRPAALKHFRMDEQHSNSFRIWKEMGKPQDIKGSDYAKLEASGKLAEIGNEASVSVKDGKIDLHFILPRQGVSLLRLDW